MNDKLTPFSYVNSISETKTYVDDLSEYNPYLINRALSYHLDTQLEANYMNLCPQLDNRMQYDFLFHSISGKKRYSKKWPKPVKSEDVDIVMQFYKYSKDKALVALSILNDQDIQELHKRLDVGGVIK